MIRCLIVGLVASLLSAGTSRAQQPVILHNTNSYPVWVATGHYAEGVMDLTGGGQHGPDSLSASGWVKILPKDATALKRYPSSLYVRAYSLTAKTWFQVRPTGPGQPRKYFFKMADFSEPSTVANSQEATAKARGGDLKDYYPLNAYRNAQTKRYELAGPNIQGGEPPLPLPPAAATAQFTNRTDSRVFFAVVSGGKSSEASLAAGQSARFPIQLGDPPASVVVTQNDGTKMTFTLPKGADYELRFADGKIKNFFK